MVQQYIKLIEKNVDGCGSDAEVCVKLSTDFILTAGHEKRLQDALKEIKNELPSDEWDTDYIVQEALQRAFGSEEKIEPIAWDIVIEFQGAFA